MIPSEAILQFIDRQKRLLRQTYDIAWQRGIESYNPDADPTDEPTLPLSMAITGLTGAALLAARRRYNYDQPRYPDPVRRAVALAPSFRGINRMATELSVLPVPQLTQWVDTNAYRLNAGDSVAWAGEQSGFAEAADADGQFLFAWVSVGDTRVCGMCEVLSGFPAMALADWPTSPGAGDTDCSVGCRCTWDTFGIPPPDTYIPQLSSDQSAVIDTLAMRQSQALTDMVSEVQYLEG